jgi:hypothetical protein
VKPNNNVRIASVVQLVLALFLAGMCTLLAIELRIRDDKLDTIHSILKTQQEMLDSLNSAIDRFEKGGE